MWFLRHCALSSFHHVAAQASPVTSTLAGASFRVQVVSLTNRLDVKGAQALPIISRHDIRRSTSMDLSSLLLALLQGGDIA